MVEAQVVEKSFTQFIEMVEGGPYPHQTAAGSCR